MEATLVLDIDGTIDTANKKALEDLKSFAQENNIPIHINTARSAEYCRHPSMYTTSLCAAKNHHCFSGADDVKTSKVQNMEKIATREKVVNRRCAVLIDDLKSNVDAVSKAGFSAIKVKSNHGIQPNTVKAAKKQLLECIGNVRSRGSDTGSDERQSDNNIGFLRRNKRCLLMMSLLLFVIVIVTVVCFSLIRSR
jgi:hypothetical protein